MGLNIVDDPLRLETVMAKVDRWARKIADDVYSEGLSGGCIFYLKEYVECPTFEWHVSPLPGGFNYVYEQATRNYAVQELSAEASVEEVDMGA